MPGANAYELFQAKIRSQHPVWIPSGEVDALFRVTWLAINPKTPTTLYAGTSGGVCKSTSGWSAAAYEEFPGSEIAIR
jgi:hypothetical protein